MPIVSVLVPVFNAENYLTDSLYSILNQTFQDFELILVDDASTDNSSTILSTFSDSRISLVQHKENKGIGEALNSGLAFAQGKYVLRMDADDIAYPNRISRQVDFMEKNPKIGVSGTLAEYFDGISFNNPVNKEYLKASLLLDSPFAHPTVIIRKEIIDKHQLQFSGYLEDYELWIKLSQLTEFGLLPEVLLKYRRSENQFTAQNSEKRNVEADKLRIEFAEIWLGRHLSHIEKVIVSHHIYKSEQTNLRAVDLLCQEFLEKDPWNSPLGSREVIKKLFVRNFYRSPRRLKEVFDLSLVSFLSIREKRSLIMKIIFN